MSSMSGFVPVFDATDPTDHGMVISVEPSQLGFLWSLRFADHVRFIEIDHSVSVRRLNIFQSCIRGLLLITAHIRKPLQ